MKKVVPFFLAFTMLFSSQAFSRDDIVMVSIEDAMNTADFKAKLDPNIRFYFGNQKHGKVLQSYGDAVSNKKTNAFNKSDIEACQWVLLGALISFQDRVKSQGGNAVINMKSFYKRNEFVSDTQVECHAGTFVSGVALKGDIVKLAK